MQAAERGNRVFVKREGERDGDGGANQSVKETPRPRERRRAALLRETKRKRK